MVEVFAAAQGTLVIFRPGLSGKEAESCFDKTLLFGAINVSLF